MFSRSLMSGILPRRYVWFLCNDDEQNNHDDNNVVLKIHLL